MAGLSSILSSASNALGSDSLGLQAAGNNLANVNNSNYAQETVVSDDNGGDDSADATPEIQQVRETLLDQQVVNETALTASLTAQSNINSQAQAAFGENIGTSSTSSASTTPTGSGLGNDISNFFNGFSSLAAAPTSTSAQQTALTGADTLAQDFNSTDSQLAQVQTNINTKLSGDTGTVNTLLSNIAGLNTQISRAEFGAPGTAVGLRDQRQADLVQLAGYLNVQTSPSSGAAGQIDVTVAGAGGTPITLVSAGAVTNPVAFNGTQFTAGTAATPITPGGGEVEGLLTANGTVQSFRDQLNQLAGQIATSVNAAYNPMGTTGDLFQLTPGSEAGTIAVTPGLTAAGLTVSATADPGDNTIANAVAGLAAQTFSTARGDPIDGTFADNYAGVVDNLGNVVATTNNNLEDQTSVQAVITQQQSSVSGVSMDQELTNVMSYERAYQASSQVISVVDTLLDTVVTDLTSTN
jgi:flagellar hook-associated protein 1 FlgK